MKVLVLAAHPDDEVLGCGGTMARLAHRGHAVFCAILAEGITSRYAQREAADQVLLDTLHSASHRVAALLGIKQLFMYNLPDNQLDTVAMLDVVKIIEGLVDQIQPEVVYTQHGGDLNVDHGIVYRAVLTATRPMAGTPVKKIYAYEVASSTEWAFQQFSPRFRPNTFVDIHDTLNLKLQAMQIYESEARVFPHPRSPEALTAIAHRWGSVVGVEAAEAFELVRDVQ